MKGKRIKWRKREQESEMESLWEVCGSKKRTILFSWFLFLVRFLSLVFFDRLHVREGTRFWRSHHHHHDVDWEGRNWEGLGKMKSSKSMMKRKREIQSWDAVSDSKKRKNDETLDIHVHRVRRLTLMITFISNEDDAALNQEEADNVLSRSWWPLTGTEMHFLPPSWRDCSVSVTSSS